MARLSKLFYQFLFQSKNQELCKYLMHVNKVKQLNYSNAFLESREKGLITKEHIVMHMHLNSIFKLNRLYKYFIKIFVLILIVNTALPWSFGGNWQRISLL